MRQPPARLLAGGLLLMAGLTLPAFAYNFVNGLRWPGGSTSFYTDMGGGTSPSGTRWSTALEAAMQQWNDKTAFKFVPVREYIEPCTGYTTPSSSGANPGGNGDGHNSAMFRANVCGDAFGTGVLAITWWGRTQAQLGFDYIEEADIVFNSGYSWDVYTGTRKTGVVDFGRVALHELGHVLGLDHESTASAIMAPLISDLYQLQADDIAGANALYTSPAICKFIDLSINTLVRDSLDSTKDCRVQDLYNGSSDNSLIDVYKFKVAQTTRLFADMKSSVLDSVIVLADDRMRVLDIFESAASTCVAHMDRTLEAGTYLILANTYAQPKKCGTNQGSYTLGVSDSPQPMLGDTGATGGGTASAALFTGGATADGGLTYKSSFTVADSIDVTANINVDPAHVGQNGNVYVLVQASNGLSFSKNADGSFVPFSGDLSRLAAYKSGQLSSREVVTVAQGLRAAADPTLAGLSFVVYVGYSLNSKPGTILYGNDPIRFSISR